MNMERKDTIGIWNGPRREMEQSWELVRALRGGTRAMRDAAPKYLPQSRREERDPERYKKRKERTTLFPIYDRTIRKIASLPFQKPPTISGELPDPIDRIVNSADRRGTSLSTFALSIYIDAIDRGMGLFLVDNVPTEPSGMPLTEADRLDVRPYFRRIAPDNLVGFQCEERNGQQVVTELRIRKWHYVPGPAGLDVLTDTVEVWTETTVETWTREAGAASQAVPDREANAGRSTLGGYVLKLTRAHGFPYGIPLIDVYTNRIDVLHGEPPMEDLAWQNASHWQSLSMQGEALHYCRSPILKVSGVGSETAEQRPEMGPGAVITDTGENVDVSFVEIAGTSLAAGETELERIEQRCQALGMQPLLAVGGPATATGEVRADSNEKSEAQAWIEALEWAIYRGMEFAAAWVGQDLPEDFYWTLFRDSSILSGKATDVPVIAQLARDGMIPLEVAIRELVLRGVLATVDDVQALVDEIAAEKERGQEAQMRMLRDVEVARDPAKPPDEGDGGGATATAAAEGAGSVTLNELTLGVERLVRAGNPEGANKLLAEAGELLGVGSLGKVKKPAPPPGRTA